MAVQQNGQYRVGQLAKDFGIKAKDILEALGKSSSGSASSANLSPDEFSYLLLKLTENKQIDSIDDYIDGKLKVITSSERAVIEKAEAEAKAAAEAKAKAEAEAKAAAEAKAKAEAEAKAKAERERAEKLEKGAI